MSGLPDSSAYGPSQSNPNGKDVQIWERPWTLDEMRQTGANWSLAADSGLFLFLQEFSQRMLSKTHEIEKQLDGLIRDTKATDCCLHTVFNDFLMLSNTQFIENVGDFALTFSEIHRNTENNLSCVFLQRVYDEEVEESVLKPEVPEKQPEQEKTREQKEAELIPKMQEAVNYGLKVLDSAFEQLDIKAGNSDSEDEEATDRVEPILEPKDLYVDRPLPYLIGSQPFMEQEDVGLGDLSSEEMSIDSDRDSVMESEDGKEADQSDEDFDQEDEDQGSIKKKPSMMSFDDDEEEDEDGDSDIFGDSDKDDDDDEERKKTGSSSFADELAARIKGEPASKPEGDPTSLSSASKKKSKGKTETKPARVPAVDNDSNQLFEPPKMEDEDFSPFGGKSGLFSGGKGLFDDDDDEEGDLFSDAPKHSVAEEKKKSTGQTSELPTPLKNKVPSGAVAIFPDKTLFGLCNDADSVGSKENGSPVTSKTQTDPKQASTGVVGGLFDDDEDDDFFNSKSLKRSSSAGQEKAKVKKTVDLFGGDDEEGDIFSESSRAPPPLQSKKEVVDEQVKQAAPEKKMPAGAISMFGPGTKSLLTEGLRKRCPSTSEDSEKSEENGPSSDIKIAPAKPTEKPQTRGLFSDDEDAQVFLTIPKSRSKPETTSKIKANNAPLSLFNDEEEEEEEEEDLFASAEKSKSKQAKATTSQGKKPLSSSLFSDDEDQWMRDKTIVGATEAKPGGMKPRVSAPASLPGVKGSQKSSLFDDDNDDLFGAVKETSQKKPQRISLLFQDEDEGVDDKGSLFGSRPAVNNSTPSPVDKQQASVVASEVPSRLDSEKVTTPQEGRFPGEKRVATKKPDVQSSLLPPEASEAKKKPIGAVSLFGGIDVLAKKTSKSPLDELDGEDDILSKDSRVEKEKGEKEEQDIKVKNKTLSLFDEEDDDWTAPISIPSSKTDSQNILKAPEERTHTKSTGVFQDEELLFSQTQQKDNDPDVDLFATPSKTVSAKPSSSKSSAPTLFVDDDDDDLFSSKAPPPVSDKPRKPTQEESPSKPVATIAVPESEKPATSPVKAKEPSSQIGKIQTNLLINPATLLPGAVPLISGGVSVLPGLVPAASLGGLSHSPSPSLITRSSVSPILTPVGGAQAATGEGVNFDSPAQVTTLQSANKGRTKGSVRRRPQSRAARQQSAQNSIDEEIQESSGPNPVHPRPALPNSSRLTPDQSSPTLPSPTNTEPTTALPFQPPLTDVSTRPSVLTLPVSTNPQKIESAKSISKPKVLPSPDENDLFGSDGLFGSIPAPKLTTPSTISETTTTEDLAGSSVAVRKGKEKDTAPSIFDDHSDNLFQKVKPRSAQKATVSSFLEKDDDEEDIFGFGKGSTPTAALNSSANLTNKDIFQDQVKPLPQTNKKHTEKSLDASLFDDNIDIFADLTLTSKPKEKPSKKRVETKSLFGDDMDDIFSSGPAKPVAKTSVKPKKTPPALDASAAEDSTGNIFDDPLNALGGT
ncbi:WASH complex subunit 2 isoform X4 [Hypomesus transpacificus]|uniref:WASH complex subunit 2 isoform X4 n=1 Tax=Hypomesus transpacificus TaxID=137520 RepID=UPI001F087857|nr:WASH complex subunit 2 isoform X4 [Hypomesus transpacificus]